MVNYQNSKIYKLWSDQSSCFYIGSTTQSLAMRLGEHKRAIKRQQSKTHEKMEGQTNIKIELIEVFPCTTREELVAREGYHIRLHREQLINSRIAGRTPAEYYVENKTRIAAYREANKEKIFTRATAYREANKEKIAAYFVAYQDTHKEQISTYKAAYGKANREKLNAKKRAWRAAKKASISSGAVC